MAEDKKPGVPIEEQPPEEQKPEAVVPEVLEGPPAPYLAHHHPLFLR